MALIYADRVKETTTTTGTGTLTLGGATAGFRAFNGAVPDGSLVTYCIEDGTNWEVGQGVFTVSGTTLTRALVLSSSNAGALVSWAAGSKNVFLTLAARDVPITTSLLYGLTGTTGCLAATYDRVSADPTFSSSALSSGVLRVIAMILPAGMPVTNISFFSGTTAAGTPTNQWFTLLSAARSVLAKTADDTTTAWGTNVKKTLAITGGPFVTAYTGLYYVGVVVVATTPPTLEQVAGGSGSGSRGMAPIMGGNSSSGLTNPASLTGTASGITSASTISYVELS